MNYLLEQQIKKIFNNQTPSSLEWDIFLQIVSNTYDKYDKDCELSDDAFDNKKIEELNQNRRLLIKKEEDLVIENKRLLEVDKIKTEFISVIAHQLRTPLNATKWVLSLLIDEYSKNLTLEQRDLVKKGYESNERMINLVNDMLEVTRIESGKVQYSLTLVHIEDIINSLLSDFVGLAFMRKINIFFDKPIDQLPYINVAPEKIRGAIQNLIENALVYTKSGGSVVVRAMLENNMVKVSIEDNGIGIPEKQQADIFNKFFRADNAAKMQTDGSGLGLFISKDIIEKHGGQIGFESVVDKGTIFYFTLPIAKQDNAKS
ncbi:MAG: HAMP domain-containing sensor histidine kinase [Minisyncoccia bacterium]